MQNEQISSFTKIKSISDNILSNAIPDITNKAQTIAQNLNTESKKKLKNAITKKRRRKKQKPISSLIHRLFRPELFFKNEKVKSYFFNYFNIKELIILMEVNSIFYEIIIQSECFKKYMQIRNEFILKENIYQKILISNKEETTNYTSKNKKTQKSNNSPENNINILHNDNNNDKYKKNILNNNQKISQSRVYYEKFNAKEIKNPVKFGLNNILTIYPTLEGEN